MSCIIFVFFLSFWLLLGQFWLFSDVWGKSRKPRLQIQYHQRFSVFNDIIASYPNCTPPRKHLSAFLFPEFLWRVAKFLGLPRKQRNPAIHSFYAVHDSTNESTYRSKTITYGVFNKSQRNFTSMFQFKRNSTKLVFCFLSHSLKGRHIVILGFHVTSPNFKIQNREAYRTFF